MPWQVITQTQKNMGMAINGKWNRITIIKCWDFHDNHINDIMIINIYIYILFVWIISGNQSIFITGLKIKQTHRSSSKIPIAGWPSGFHLMYHLAAYHFIFTTYSTIYSIYIYIPLYAHCYPIINHLTWPWHRSCVTATPQVQLELRFGPAWPGWCSRVSSWQWLCCCRCWGQW